MYKGGLLSACLASFVVLVDIYKLFCFVSFCQGLKVSKTPVLHSKSNREHPRTAKYEGRFEIQPHLEELALHWKVSQLPKAAVPSGSLLHKHKNFFVENCGK